ncbi:MAG TPA: CU044_2847 family protein [Mycobacteriales bacterium]|nr:CU044_2847 family protein [Mycobacteriales bacterium]
MSETRLVTAATPSGQVVVLPVVDLDDDGPGGPGGEQLVAGGLPSLSDAMGAIEDFSAGFRKAMEAVAPRRATVEFSMSFAMRAGKLTALFVDGKAEGSVTVTLEWGKDE